MSKRVMLIEDEPNIIEAISFILSREGLSVDTHSDGTTANDKLRASPPDLLILDVMLPGKSGYDILRELREEASAARAEAREARRTAPLCEARPEQAPRCSHGRPDGAPAPCAHRSDARRHFVPSELVLG